MNGLDIMDTTEALTLSELNEQVSEAINHWLPDTYWIQAETSDVRVNASSGHCYLEFVEKDHQSGQIVARARGTIWAQTFYRLKDFFEETTGQTFVSGLKVLVNVSVEFHKLYGYSLNVLKIDPTYTIGDLIKRRMEIIQRLQTEGIFDLNRELPFPLLPQRIAIITSPTAAGYEDFVNQLVHNKFGYPFYLKLFPAIMQGEKTEVSVIEALDKVYDYAEHFDVVVIIRGGGAAADLHCFDSYLLASHCAQFPLPVITGIGHERDDTVVDIVAHTRLKTPTAVAAFLIERVDEQADELVSLQQTMAGQAVAMMSEAQMTLNCLTTQFTAEVSALVEQNRSRLYTLSRNLTGVRLYVEKNNTVLREIGEKVQHGIKAILTAKKQELNLYEQFLKLVSPEYILKKGYALIIKDGNTVKSAKALMAGDEITMRFADGERKAKIQGS